nr:hypothetical protein [Tanacetum cinerariifolium]
MDSKNDNGKIDMPSSPKPKNLYVPFGIPFDPKQYYKDGAHTNITEDKIIPYGVSSMDMAPLPSRDQRHHGSDTRLRGMMRVLYTATSRGSRQYRLGGDRRRMTWRQIILALGLHTEEDMVEFVFKAYWQGSKRVIPNKGDLRDYWIEISMIAYNIVGRGGHLRRHVKSRKSGARLSGGHFIRHLRAYFGLVGDQRLKGLLMVTSELPLIDLHELGRLNICERIGDTWALVALGLDRQPNAAVGAVEAAEDAHVVDKDAHAVSAPVQAPQPPPPAPYPQTMPQRIERVEEEIQELWQSIICLQ